MNVGTDTNVVANWFLLVGVFPVLAFTIDYVILNPLRNTRPWWRSAVGIMFALLGLCLTLLGLLIIINIILGADYPGRAVVRVVGYGIFVVATTSILTVYVVERRSPKPIIFTPKRNNRKDTP